MLMILYSKLCAIIRIIVINTSCTTSSGVLKQNDLLSMPIWVFPGCLSSKFLFPVLQISIIWGQDYTKPDPARCWESSVIYGEISMFITDLICSFYCMRTFSREGCYIFSAFGISECWMFPGAWRTLFYRKLQVRLLLFCTGKFKTNLRYKGGISCHQRSLF